MTQIIDKAELNSANRIEITHKVQRAVEQVRLDLRGVSSELYVGMYRSKATKKKFFYIPLVGGNCSGEVFQSICSVKYNEHVYVQTPKLLGCEGGGVARSSKEFNIDKGERYNLVGTTNGDGKKVMFYLTNIYDRNQEVEIQIIYETFIRNSALHEVSK